MEEGKPPSSLCDALFVVLPKPDKDKLLCGSYCPISLLNSDVKVLAKILALRLQKVILHLVHRDQTGFIAWEEYILQHLFAHSQGRH